MTVKLITAPPTLIAAPPPPGAIAGRSKDGRVWKAVNSPIFDGFEEIPVPEIEPYLNYRWAKMSLDEWKRGLAFLQWNYDKNKDEGLLFIMGNDAHPELGLIFWAPPQKGFGMNVECLYDHDQYGPQRAAIGQTHPDMYGTVHDHCGGSAFQSGTDKTGEAQTDGLHLTVGSLGSAKLTLHSRHYKKKQEWTAVLTQWFELPPVAPGWEALYSSKMQGDLLEGFLTTPLAKSDWDAPGAFPALWKENLIKPARVTTHYQQDWQGHAHGQTYWSDRNYTPANLSKKEKKWRKWKEKELAKERGTPDWQNDDLIWDAELHGYRPKDDVEWQKMIDGEEREDLYASFRSMANLYNLDPQSMSKMVGMCELEFWEAALDYGIKSSTELLELVREFWEEELKLESKVTHKTNGQ